MLEIIGEENGFFILECSICSKDKEMYPLIKQRIGCFKRGKIPCGCSKIPKYSQDQWKILLKRSLNKRDGRYRLIEAPDKLKAKSKLLLWDNTGECERLVSLYDFVSKPDRDGLATRAAKARERLLSMKPKVKAEVDLIFESYPEKSLLNLYHSNSSWNVEYKCDKCKELSCRGVFKTKVKTLKDRGFLCKCYSKSFKRDKEDVVKETKDKLYSLGYEYLGLHGEYNGYGLTRVIWNCDKGHKNIQILSNMRRDNYRCKTCSKKGFKMEGDAYLYVVSFSVDETSYLKFGVTSRSSVDLRLRQIFTNMDYDLVTLLSGCGDFVWQTEKIIKDNITCCTGLNIPIYSGITEVVLHTEDNLNKINGILKQAIIGGQCEFTK